MKNKFIILLFNLVVIFYSTNGQSLENKVFKHHIKTIQLHKEGWPHSYPLIELNSADKLVLSFDELTADLKDYNYTIIHCDANWEPSDISESEYLTGINQNPVLDYQYSFNTSTDYIHYKITFPNEDFSLNYSGNYVIKIYESSDTDSPVLTWRFMVTEQLAQVVPEIKYSLNAELSKGMQEVDFTIFHPNLKIDNPLQDVKVNIIQNQRQDNMIANLKPQYIKTSELIYDYNRETMFEGGNEFRWLDIRSLRFQSEKIKEINFHPPFSHVELFPEKHLDDASYFFRNDFNGRYVIEVQEQRDPEIESDYVFVHFYLSSDAPVPGGDVYVFGELSNWKMNNQNKMTYNGITKQYEATLLLKQGFYNYQYIFKPNQLDKGSLSLFEGSYSQTENDYLILVYYRGIGDYYDRLIGAKQANSLKPDSSQ